MLVNANRPFEVLELDLSGFTNRDLTAQIVKASVFCVKYLVIWLHRLWPNGSPDSRFSLACLSISQNSFGRRGLRKDSLLYSFTPGGSSQLLLSPCLCWRNSISSSGP